MPQLISIAAQTSSKFDTLIASPFDLGNIQEAFIFYHYGIKERGEEPDPKSIHSYLKNIKNAIDAEEPIIQSLLETYNLLEDFYSNSAGSVENISDLTIFEPISASVQNISNDLNQTQQVIDIVNSAILQSFNVKTSNYVLQLSDNKKMIIANPEPSSPMIIFIPLDNQVNFPVGSNIDIINIGQSNVFIEGDSVISLDPKIGGFVETRGDGTLGRNNQVKTIYKRATNDWVIIQ